MPPDATDWATYRTHAPFIEIIKAYIRPFNKKIQNHYGMRLKVLLVFVGLKLNLFSISCTQIPNFLVSSLLGIWDLNLE